MLKWAHNIEHSNCAYWFHLWLHIFSCHTCSCICYVFFCNVKWCQSSVSNVNAELRRKHISACPCWQSSFNFFILIHFLEMVNAFFISRQNRAFHYFTWYLDMKQSKEGSHNHHEHWLLKHLTLSLHSSLVQTQNVRICDAISQEYYNWISRNILLHIFWQSKCTLLNHKFTYNSAYPLCTYFL